jgi:hypothetical protein
MPTPDQKRHLNEEIIYSNLTEDQRLMCLILAVADWEQGVDDEFVEAMAVDRAILQQLMEIFVVKQFSLVDILEERLADLQPKYEVVRQRLTQVTYKQLQDSERAILNTHSHLLAQIQRAKDAGDLHYRLYSEDFHQAVRDVNPISGGSKVAESPDDYEAETNSDEDEL